MGWLESFVRSLALALGSVGIATVLAVPTWWLLSANPSRQRVIRRIAILVSIAIAATPILVHAMTWEASIGRFGYWTTLIGGRSAVFMGYYGSSAAVWVHGYVGAAWMFLMLSMHWRWVEPRFRDRLRLECRGGVQTMSRVASLMLPAWSLAAAWIGLLAMTEMTVADLYAFTTLPDRFYRRFAVTGDLCRVAAESLPWAIVIGATGAWWRQRSVEVYDAGRSDERSFVDGAAQPSSDGTMQESPRRLPGLTRWVWCIGLAIGMLGVPAVGWAGRIGHTPGGSFDASLTVTRLGRAFTENQDELMWTMILSLGTSMLSVATAWLMVLWTNPKRSTRCFADGSMLTLFCIPAPIIGLAFASFFTLPVPGFRTLYQNTLIPTLWALVCKGGPVAYLVLSSVWRGTGESFRDRARMEHPPLRRMLWEYPRWMAQPLAVAMAASALIVAGDVAITMRVTPPAVSTAAARLFGLLHSGARFQEAALGFWFAAIAMLVIASVGLLRVLGPRRKVLDL